ncbi:AbrB/MazE/SpoVT family DNA-binding domain-containing protein [Candidatus Acetothermia bacterium]|nr:AbrB/MazE/SpoVT family DNA-binding domain-containing protein [Candidatus Acetothermia bacterium]
MKTKTYVEKVRRNGEIRLSAYLKTLGICPGAEVAVTVTEERLLIKPVKEAVACKKKNTKDPVEALTGALPLDPELIEEIAHGSYVPEDV